MSEVGQEDFSTFSISLTKKHHHGAEVLKYSIGIDISKDEMDTLCHRDSE